MKTLETTVSKLRRGMKVKMASGQFVRIKGTHITHTYRINNEPAVWIDLDTGSYAIALPTDPAFVEATATGEPLFHHHERKPSPSRAPRRHQPVTPRAVAEAQWLKIWRQK